MKRSHSVSSTSPPPDSHKLRKLDVSEADAVSDDPSATATDAPGSSPEEVFNDVVGPNPYLHVALSRSLFIN